MSLSKEEKVEIIKKFGSDAKNSGKTEVQVALLTRRIAKLTEHMKENSKDHHCTKNRYSRINLFLYIQD